eukprot:CAMPEP_0181098200 /NCGR_PEP_ID=MMETSP1071-20121207/11993_1 /TAXON_ID=35127 /ORGANISM="Thalassiosira sp., Strain NH16" /LENGTH=171 /DNA_ID=CAMNT_0023180767 /DNA_START=145 /DNA_END=657 /DNA_ORIENTATION=-
MMGLPDTDDRFRRLPDLVRLVLRHQTASRREARSQALVVRYGVVRDARSGAQYLEVVGWWPEFGRSGDAEEEECEPSLSTLWTEAPPPCCALSVRRLAPLMADAVPIASIATNAAAAVHDDALFVPPPASRRSRATAIGSFRRHSIRPIRDCVLPTDVLEKECMTCIVVVV